MCKFSVNSGSNQLHVAYLLLSCISMVNFIEGLTVFTWILDVFSVLFLAMAMMSSSYHSHYPGLTGATFS